MTETGTIIAVGIAALIPSLGFAAAWGASRQRLISHEALDSERFASINKSLDAIHADLKDLMRVSVRKRAPRR